MRKISKVNFRDVQALNGLRLCGYALRSDMERIISRNRVETLLKQGYIETKKDIHNREVLTYTTKGKAFINVRFEFTTMLYQLLAWGKKGIYVLFPLFMVIFLHSFA